MNIKSWLQWLAKCQHAQLREMVELLSGMRGQDKRSATEEALLQDYIASLPDAPDDGNAERLKQARLAAGRCCECGNLPRTETEEISA